MTEKPFKIGDIIEGDNYSGIVENITLRSIKIRTDDNSVINVPNLKITTECVTNISEIDNRRFNLPIYISYGIKIEKVRRVMDKVRLYLENNEKVLTETISIKFEEIAKEGMKITINCYIDEAKKLRFLVVKEKINFEIMKVLEGEGIELYTNNIRIKNVDLPLGLIEIEDSTFEGCRTLESVIIPQGVKYLGEYAFLNSGLKRVVLPAGLEEISYGAFKDCYNLVEINLPSSIIDIKGGSFYGTKYLDSIKEDEYGCKYQENILLEYTGKSAEKIEIKAGTRLIAGSAFNNAESIKEVYIPKSVEHIGRYTFTKCYNLEKVEFEEGSKLETIESYAFSSCNSLKSISLPINLKSVSQFAFWWCGFETIRIPENVEYLDLWAIADCLYLKRIELPKSLEGKYYWISDRPKPEIAFY